MRTKAQEIAAYTWLRVSAVAEELDCSVQHVHDLIAADAFGDGVINIGTGRRSEYRISREALDRFLRARTVIARAS